MEVYIVDVYAWTASFRYPNLISGMQPTLDVPPLSTVLGLLNAAAGRYLVHEDLEIGYYFEYQAKEFDLETIYQLEANAKGQVSSVAKQNILRREFLVDARLRIYLTDEELVGYLQHPAYPLLLGRSGDLATVRMPKDSVRSLPEQPAASKIKGQVVPFKGNFLPGTIQALPQYFSDSLPRNNLGTRPYSVVRFDAPDFQTHLPAIRDEEIGVDIFRHRFSSADYE